MIDIKKMREELEPWLRSDTIFAAFDELEAARAEIEKYKSFVASVEVQAGQSEAIDALIRYAGHLGIRSRE